MRTRARVGPEGGDGAGAWVAPSPQNVASSQSTRVAISSVDSRSRKDGMPPVGPYTCPQPWGRRDERGCATTGARGRHAQRG